MKITIHDVEHGACMEVTAPNGVRYLLDAGCSSKLKWWPSAAYAGADIDLLILQNLDRDHVEDLPDLLRFARVRAVFSNPHVHASALLSMKPEGLQAMHPGIRAAYDHLAGWGAGLVGPLPNADLSEGWVYYNNMSHGGFVDTNNLSVVSYFRWGDFAILFGGDMETPGWDQLLMTNYHLRERLRYVRVYVASHHGRENGKSDQLFRFMQPDLVVFSDGPVEHGTQLTADWYRNGTHGAWVRGPNEFLPAQRRHVVTTRRDGTISIDVTADGTWTVETSRQPLPHQRPSLMAFYNTG